MQHFLWLNRELLAPHLSLMLLRHMKPVIRKAARFSAGQNPLELLDMAALLDQAFDDNPPHPGTDLIISSEGLSGDVPGLHGVADYSAVPALATYLTGYLTDRFPAARVQVILTTRGAEDWLFSTYRHLLRNTRLTLDRAEFAARYAAAADLDACVARIAEAIDPVPVSYLPLRQAATNLKGPGAALLDRLPLPAEVRAALQPVGHGNEGPEARMWQQFLSLNRSALSDDEVSRLKSAMAEAVDLGGWRKADPA